MQLNLARKWRSKRFDELVGQSLAIRLVKNSLYRNLVFPVYLLSGTRGCGKTSLARIFAAALNCQKLELFQKNPQEILPCLTCASCIAMQGMNHPDFIEIDAASHTGVDNVRQIIDAASFVPVLGTKKIYLIDEAHMLSKAAFNAFLKILEEPPTSVIFMLATTDPHKILDTVTSRCFQLYFEPIKREEVVKHLAFICTQENLAIEDDALMLIAQETEGSMRDALNLLERLRTLSLEGSITKQQVRDLLGGIDDARIVELLQVIAAGEVNELLNAYQRLEIGRYTPLLVWKKLVEMIRQAVWLKHGQSIDAPTANDALKSFVATCSYEKLVRWFELCASYELSFSKTAVPEALLEMLLVKMCMKDDISQKQRADKPQAVQIPKGSAVPTVRSQPAQIKKEPIIPVAPIVEKKVENSEEIKQAPIQPQKIEENKELTTWHICLKELEKIQDPLVVSIFRQTTQDTYSSEQKTLELIFSKDLEFFKDWLGNTKKIWNPIIEKFFGEGTQLISHFTGVSTKERPVKIEPVPVKENRPAPLTQKTSAPMQPTEKIMKQVDAQKWQKGSLVLSMFPGTLVVKEGS